MNHRVVEAKDTNRGRRVCIAVTATGSRVAIKSAESDEFAREIRRQARHYLRLSRLLGRGAPFPDVLEASRRHLILPYFEHGTLREVRGPGRRDLLDRAITLLFEVAASAPADARYARDGDAGRRFLIEQVRLRKKRLTRALQHDATARAWGGRAVRGSTTNRELVAEATRWIEDGTLDALASRTRGPLGLASHGDFVLDNVLLRDPPGPSSRLVFIDVRGIWHGGLPWWDPMLDLASLIAFECRIEPARRAVDGSAPGRPATSEEEIRSLCAGNAAFQRWVSRDPGWEARLEVHVATRLLGNVSVELTTARHAACARASLALRELDAQAARLPELVS